MFPMEKYRFYQSGNKVVAVTTYAGRTVRGTSKCDPRDTFDIEKGKQLAAARCAVKVAKKRASRANKKWQEARQMAIKADSHAVKMSAYVLDANKAVEQATAHLQAVKQKV